ncbi:hypothetical protein ACQEU6_13535 [Spirillospora sp. CA-108201]
MALIAALMRRIRLHSFGSVLTDRYPAEEFYTGFAPTMTVA